MSDIAAHGGRRLKTGEMLKLWRRAVIERSPYGRAGDGVGHLSRATITYSGLRHALGADLPDAVAVRLGVEACARLLVSAHPAKTVLDVQPRTMQVFVGTSRVFAELADGEHRVFRSRVSLQAEGELSGASVEVWEEPNSSAHPGSGGQDGGGDAQSE